MPDYLALLESKDIHERADAGRQLAKVGTPEHLPRLLQHAFEDPSPGVRLYAVGGAADILSRYRVGPEREVLSLADRMAILENFGHLDPAVNAGMFSVLANLGMPKHARRILVGLQDPRLDVRTGACVGIYRYCVSSEGAADHEMRARILQLMRGRLRPDALGALARLCAECGWQDSRETLMTLLDREDQAAEAADLALERLDAMEQPSFMSGIWMSWGADAAERHAQELPTSWMLLTEGLGVELDPQGARAFAWTSTQTTVRGLEPIRVFLPEPLTHEHRPGFLLGEHAWYEAPEKAVGELAALFSDVGHHLPEAMRGRAAASIVNLLPSNIGGKRLAAQVELAAGNPTAARVRLEELVGSNKGGADALYWLGETCLVLGDEKAAHEAFEAYLGKAPKRHPMRGRVAEVLDT